MRSVSSAERSACNGNRFRLSVAVACITVLLAATGSQDCRAETREIVKATKDVRLSVEATPEWRESRTTGAARGLRRSLGARLLVELEWNPQLDASPSKVQLQILHGKRERMLTALRGEAAGYDDGIVPRWEALDRLKVLDPRVLLRAAFRSSHGEVWGMAQAPNLRRPLASHARAVGVRSGAQMEEDLHALAFRSDNSICVILISMTGSSRAKSALWKKVTGLLRGLKFQEAI